jgi:hypothetical protein
VRIHPLRKRKSSSADLEFVSVTRACPRQSPTIATAHCAPRTVGTAHRSVRGGLIELIEPREQEDRARCEKSLGRAMTR